MIMIMIIEHQKSIKSLITSEESSKIAINIGNVDRINFGEENIIYQG